MYGAGRKPKVSKPAPKGARVVRPMVGAPPHVVSSGSQAQYDARKSSINVDKKARVAAGKKVSPGTNMLRPSRGMR